MKIQNLLILMLLQKENGEIRLVLAPMSPKYVNKKQLRNLRCNHELL